MFSKALKKLSIQTPTLSIHHFEKNYHNYDIDRYDDSRDSLIKIYQTLIIHYSPFFDYADPNTLLS